MKKYLALLAAVMMLVCAGTAFSADSGSTAGHGGNSPSIGPDKEFTGSPAVDGGSALDETPTTPGGEAEEPAPEDSGSEEAKTPEAAVSAGDTHEDKQVVEDVTENVEVPQLSDSDKDNSTSSTSTGDATEPPETTTQKLELKTPTDEQKETYNNILTSTETSDGQQKTNEQKGRELATQMLEDGRISEEVVEEWSCMIESYLNGSEEADFDTFVEQSGEAITQLPENEEFAKRNVAGNTSTDPSNYTQPDSNSSTAQKVTASAEGDTIDMNEFAKLTAEQETLAGNDGASDYPVAVGPKTRFINPAVALYKLNVKKSVHGVKAKAKTYKTGGGNGGQSSGNAFASALDTTTDGSAVLLNSAGQETDHIPGYGETDKSASTGEDIMVIPGYVKIAFYGVPGTDYTPYIAVPAEALATVAKEEVTTTTQTVVTGQQTVTRTVTVPVYHSPTAGYSTSFDSDLKAYFRSQGYDNTIGLYIVSGEAGVWSATEDSGDVMLNAYSRAVVRTLPKIRVTGDTASTSADYTIRVRYSIPVNTDTRIISGDNLLEFYKNGLTVISDDGKAYPRTSDTAIFLDSTGRAPLTDAMVMRLAAGDTSFGGELSDDGSSMLYSGYAVMHLDRQGEDSDPYRPVFVVKRGVVASTTPGGDTPGGDTPGGDEPTDEPTTDPGSSGGGCSAGFSALALAVLGAFIAARKQ